MHSRAAAVSCISSSWHVGAWQQPANPWLPQQVLLQSTLHQLSAPPALHFVRALGCQHPVPISLVAHASCPSTSYAASRPSQHHHCRQHGQCRQWVQYKHHTTIATAAAAVGRSQGTEREPVVTAAEMAYKGAADSTSSYDEDEDVPEGSSAFMVDASQGLPGPDAWPGMVANWPRQTLAPGLYVVPTPIGNLADISLRALLTLHSANLVLAEDTRHTRKLLTHYGIRAHLLSYHEHNERTRVPALIQRLQQGEPIALVSDAGMPGISDPGHTLIVAAVAAGVQVIPLPGACAFLCALVASGLDTTHFTFAGFLPPKQGARLQRLQELRDTTQTLAFYVSPHSLRATLTDMVTVLGAHRRVCVARELTKRFEELLRTNLEGALQTFTDREPRGEFCLIVEGAQQNIAQLASGTQQSGAAHDLNQTLPDAAADDIEHKALVLMQQLVAQGEKPSEAAKAVSKQLGLRKKDVYALAVSSGIGQG